MRARRGQLGGAKRRSRDPVIVPRRRDTDAVFDPGVPQNDAASVGPIGVLAKDPTVALPAGNERLSGVMLLHQAMAVAAAADAYSARGRPNVSALTLQFLLARSLELALKAYLVNKDCAEDRLREFAQDLTGLLEQATTLSFELQGGTSDEDRRAITALSINYRRRMLEDPRTAGYQLLASRVLREIVHRAIAAVFAAIWHENPLHLNLRRSSDRALGLCIADDACYEDVPAGTSGR